MRMAFIALVIVLLDQLTKQLVLRVLALPVWLIPDDIGLQLSFNKGVAFSFPLEGMCAIIVSLIIIFGLLVYYFHSLKPAPRVDIVFGLIIGGAVGNLIDRFAYGSVVDFIRIYSYPSFNLADVAITLGFLLFIFFLDTMTSKKLSLF